LKELFDAAKQINYIGNFKKISKENRLADGHQRVAMLITY
jgi:hypothetical protein